VKRYGEVLALDGVDLDVLPGELVAFLGPSGCGKTTLLRVVAGLEPLSAGSLEMLGVEVNRDERLLVSPERRPVAMVFQEHALWPHLTAEENVAFPLHARGVKRAERRERARELLSLMDLDGRGERRPGELSGGELQRVALARALIVQPRILLLDEPLASLDAHLRRRLRQKIRRIHEGFSMTTLYVTHDRDEALAVADRIVLQRAGRVLDQGSPELLNARPRSAYAAQLLWDANLLPAEYLRNGWWRTPIGVLKAAAPPDDSPHVLLVHPETLARAEREPDFEGEVEEVSYRGCFWDALVNVRGEELLWRSTEPLDPGQRVGLRLMEEPSPVPDDR
jgi:ABC-type Fe3+/spermidine/putrescine transport system ATPase subunit